MSTSPAQAHTLFITLYSGPHGTGKLIGKTTLVTRTSNVSTITPDVGGQCATIAVQPEGDETYVEGTAPPTSPPTVAVGKSANIAAGTSNQGFTLVGPQPERFVATPEDAQGNPIVPLVPLLGDVSFIPVKGAGAIDIDPQGNNEFTFSARQQRDEVGAAVVPFALECAAIEPSMFRFPIPIFFTTAIYVADQTTGFQGYPTAIRVYDGNGKPVGPVSFAANNLQPGNSGLAYDTFLGRIYLANGGVSVYDTNGNPLTTSGGFPGADSVVDVAFDTTTRQVWAAQVGIPPTQGSLTIYDENGNLILNDLASQLNLGVFGDTYDPHLHRMYAQVPCGTCGGPAPPNIVAFTDNGTQVGGLTGGFYNSGGGHFAFSAIDNFLYDPQSPLGGNVPPMRIYTENGYGVVPRAATWTGLNAPTAIGVDPFYARMYVTNCPSLDPNQHSVSGFITMYSQFGLQIALPQGAFPNLGCPMAIAVVPP